MSIELVHFVEWKKIPDSDFEKTLDEVKSWGVRSIVAHPCWGLRNEEKPGYWDPVWAAIRRSGLKTPACHAYWGPVNDICQPEPAELKRVVELHRRFLEKLGEFGVKTYTMHIGTENFDGKTLWKEIRQAVESLLPTARKCGIILALENGNEHLSTQQELADFVASFADPFVGVCFDTGHAHCYGDRDWKRSMAILAPHIVTCHMHDNFGTFDDHNPPGEGNLNWQELTAALKALPRLCHAETESGNWSEESWNRFRKVWNY